MSTFLRSVQRLMYANLALAGVTTVCTGIVSVYTYSSYVGEKMIRAQELENDKKTIKTRTQELENGKKTKKTRAQELE